MAFAQPMNELARACRILNEIHKAAYTQANNVHTLLGSLEEFLQDNRLSSKVASARALRPSLSGLLSPDFVQRFLTPFARSVVEGIGEHDNGYAKNMVAIRDYMAANAQTVLTSTYSLGAIVSPAGGTLVIYSEDKHNVAFDSGIPESFALECTADKDSGSPEWQEVFEFLGSPVGIDSIDLEAGTGEQADIVTLIDEASPQNMLANPSFTAFNGTAPTVGAPTAVASVTDFPRWTLSATAPFLAANDYTHRDLQGRTTQKSLKQIADGWFEQILTGSNAPKRLIFEENKMYTPAIRVYKDGTITGGTADIKLGSQTVVSALSLAGLAAGWNTIYVATADANKLYHGSFKQASDMTLRVTVAGLVLGTATGLFWDDCELAQARQIKGLPCRIYGNNVRHVKGDQYTASIARATQSVVQYWAITRTKLWEDLSHPIWLPHAGVPTVADVQP